MPPEAPTEGLKTKERRVGGRKEEARKVEISESLVSWRQRIKGRAVWTASLTSSRFLCIPRPRTFQQSRRSLINIDTRVAPNITRQEKRKQINAT
jgi:hypothetical protein